MSDAARSPVSAARWIAAARFTTGGLVIAAAAGTDVGTARSVNEDAVALVPARGVALVVDGLGSHPRDERVTAGSAIAEITVAELEDGATLVEALAGADADLRADAARDPRGALGGAAVAIEIGAGEVTIAHVGDCRAYRWRAGALVAVTRDHTLGAAFADGTLAADVAAHVELMPYHHNVLLRALGFGEVEIDTHVEATAPGDRWILCSDGVHAVLDDGALAAMVGDGDPATAVARVLDAACARRTGDNASVAVLVITGA